MKWFLMIMQLLPVILEMVKKIEEVIPKGGIGDTVKGPALAEMISIASGGNTEVDTKLGKIVPVMVKMINDGKEKTVDPTLVEK